MSHVKTIDGYDVKVPSMGQVNYNTVASSIGLANAVFGNNGGGILGGLLGGIGNRNGCCEGDHLVNRYELAMMYAESFKKQAHERGYVNLFGIELGPNAFEGLCEILSKHLR